MKTIRDKHIKGMELRAERKHKNVWIGLAAALFVASAVFGFTRSALVSQQGKREESNLRYERQEEEYVERARKVLEEAGLDRAGIMLEYTQEADQTRSYTLYVHHRRWGKLGEEEKGRLEKELEDCAFEEDDCVFSCDFSG